MLRPKCAYLSFLLSEVLGDRCSVASDTVSGLVKYGTCMLSRLLLESKANQLKCNKGEGVS